MTKDEIDIPQIQNAFYDLLALLHGKPFGISTWLLGMALEEFVAHACPNESTKSESLLAARHHMTA